MLSGKLLKDGEHYLQPKVIRCIIRLHMWRYIDPYDLHDAPSFSGDPFPNFGWYGSLRSLDIAQQPPRPKYPIRIRSRALYPAAGLAGI